DGKAVASTPAGPTPGNINGFFRIGCMQLTNFPEAPARANECFAGNMQYAAAYNRPLTATEVLQHYQAGI
ncbi:LamG domain-containing protein, partial [Arthrobacter sp. UM1]|nr:LamG domain-containing protein [Arthrobacter sp. UM1]